MEKVTFKKGDKIKWLFTDELGKGSHIGLVTEVTKVSVEFRARDEAGRSCTMRVPLEGHGTFEHTDEEIQTALPVIVELAKPKKERAKSTDSKAAKALELYQNSEDKSRKAIVALFKAELSMSDAGAQTYYYNVKKEAAKAAE